MKKITTVFFICLFTMILTSCNKNSSFNGSRTGNNTRLIMKYSIFNTSDSQILDLEKGDIIDVKIVNDEGELSIKLQKEGSKEPIYVGNNVPTSEFQVSIEESGKYLLKVDGKQTKGSLSFIKE